MNVYLDTSVVLRVLFREPEPVSVWGEWTKAYSSRLWLTEACRTIDRLRLMNDLSDRDVAELLRKIRLIDETFEICPLTEPILRRAAESFPTSVGTLDAIHLATALYLRENVSFDLFLTHDEELGIAARAIGFEVTGID